MLKAAHYSLLDFVKESNETYFELLRLARISECAPECSANHVINHDVTNHQVIDRKIAIALLNQLPLLKSEHKRIIPLLNDKAHKLAIFDELSIESQQALTTITQQGIVTELARKVQLKSIIDALSGDNIPLVLLKGAAFADVLYSPQAPRTSNDLDILIQKKDWHKAVSIIKALMNYTEKLQPDVFGDLYELCFVPKGKMGAALDLHASLINPLLFKISEAQLWDCSVKHPRFDNELVRMLSPEHALIHQALHAYKDMNFSKYNLLDSHEIIHVQKPNINKTISIAKEWGASVALFVLLKNCTEIMGSDLNGYSALNEHSNVNRHTDINYGNSNSNSNNSRASSKDDLLLQMKPNSVVYNVIIKLIKSRFSQPSGNEKSLRYRANQILGQFVFSGSVLRPLALQWLFVKSAFTAPKT